MQARRAGLPEVEVLEIENGEPSMLLDCGLGFSGFIVMGYRV